MEGADAIDLFIGLAAELFRQALLQQLRRQQIPCDNGIKIAADGLRAYIAAVIKGQADVGLFTEKGIKDSSLPIQQQAVYI